jgi:hypothetical protein
MGGRKRPRAVFPLMTRMTGHSPKAPKPDPRDDAELEHERSSVRPRVAPTSAESVDQLLQRAKILLADLPADHPRAQLLRVALWRRDAALLRALLEELQDPSARTRKTLLPPPRG